jgi:hypothetical protein
MQPGRVFLDKGNLRLACFGQFPLLSQLRRCLKLGKTDIRHRPRRKLSTLLLFKLDFFFDEGVVTKPGGASEDDQRQQQHEEPLHKWQSAIVNPSEVRRV